MVEGRFFIYAIALFVLTAAAALIAVRMLAARRNTRYEPQWEDDEERPLTEIPLLFQPRSAGTVFAPEPYLERPVPTPTPEVAPRAAAPASTPRQSVTPPQAAPTHAFSVAAPPPVHENGLSPRQAADFTSPPASVDEGPLQLLPGRLEPVNRDTHQEIRFVKVPGVTRITFGRSPGPPYEHVQLRAATASRMHGYMAFESGRWRIGNLSETNRVLVNGSPLMEAAGRLLEDGDQLEFGEVAFVFRER